VTDDPAGSRGGVSLFFGMKLTATALGDPRPRRWLAWWIGA
jgi:hypothetical protein